jgi:hypothetical protein
MEALERIAIALERIANALESPCKQEQVKKEETPFPWHETDTRVQNVADLNKIDGKLATTQYLLQIGRKAFARGKWYNLGVRSIVKHIDPIMYRLGAGEQWMKS